jgi:hypothetical protein
LLLNSTQVRELLSISTDGKPLSRYKLWQEIKSGRLKAKKAPSSKARLIFTRKEVERYLEESLDDACPSAPPPEKVTPIRKARRNAVMRPDKQ